MFRSLHRLHHRSTPAPPAHDAAGRRMQFFADTIDGIFAKADAQARQREGEASVAFGRHDHR